MATKFFIKPKAFYIGFALLMFHGANLLGRQIISEEISNLYGHNGLVLSLAHSSDGRYVASGGQDSTIRIWEAKNGTLLGSWKAHSEVVSALTFSKDGRYLASVSPDRMIKLWEMPQGRLVKSFADTANAALAVAISHDAEFIVSAGTDNLIKPWPWNTGERILFSREHLDWVSVLSFSDDGNSLISAGYDGSVKLWDFKTGRIQRNLTSRAKVIHAISSSHNGKSLACGGSNGVVEVWQFPGLNDGKVLATNTDEILSLTFSPNDKWLAAGSVAGKAYLWDAATLTPLPNIQVEQNPINCLIFTIGQQDLLWAGARNAIKVWRLRRNEPPTLTVKAPTAGATNDSTFGLDMTCADDWGIDSLVVKVNGKMLLDENYAWNTKAQEPPLGKTRVEVKRPSFSSLKIGDNLVEMMIADMDGKRVFAKTSINYRPKDLMEEGPALVLQGERLYKQAKFKSAVEKLQQAINIFLKYPSDEHRDAQLIKAYLFTGSAQLGLRNNNGAEQSFREALKLNPALNLTPPLDSPKIKTFFNRIAGRQ